MEISGFSAIKGWHVPGNWGIATAMSSQIPVIFQNEHFLAVVKPPTVLTVPSRWGNKEERRCLGTELQRDLKRQIFPIHRLDFEVSGIVLFGLSAKGQSAASKAFENNKVQKTYWAVTQDLEPETSGKPESRFLWKSKILRGKKRSYESPVGSWAITEAAVKKNIEISERTRLRFWHLWPKTGKPHQLRYELSKQGFPILNDTLYGAKKLSSPSEEGTSTKIVENSGKIVENTGLALKAVSLVFDSESRELASLGLPFSLSIFTGSKTADFSDSKIAESSGSKIAEFSGSKIAEKIAKKVAEGLPNKFANEKHSQLALTEEMWAEKWVEEWVTRWREFEN